MSARPEPGPPLWLLAELTYRCPLRCGYCSNPTEFELRVKGIHATSDETWKTFERPKESV